MYYVLVLGNAGFENNCSVLVSGQKTWRDKNGYEGRLTPATRGLPRRLLRAASDNALLGILKK